MPRTMAMATTTKMTTKMTKTTTRSKRFLTTSGGCY
jgi:hypothetical protein